MKYKIYISHTAYCSGWDIDNILNGTIFNKGSRTMRFPKEHQVKMLDWDYRIFKNRPGKVIERHIEIINNNDLEVIMLPDFMGNEKKLILDIYKKSKTNARMVIPVHSFEKWLLDFELALPNANWFKTNPDVPLEYYDNITHLLGGSPHSHIQLVGEFENVVSMDGNQIYNVAIKTGKYWQNNFPKWKKEPGLTNQEAFKKSVINVNEVFK